MTFTFADCHSVAPSPRRTLTSIFEPGMPTTAVPPCGGTSDGGGGGGTRVGDGVVDRASSTSSELAGRLARLCSTPPPRFDDEPPFPFRRLLPRSPLTPPPASTAAASFEAASAGALPPQRPWLRRRRRHRRRPKALPPRRRPPPPPPPTAICRGAAVGFLCCADFCLHHLLRHKLNSVGVVGDLRLPTAVDVSNVPGHERAEQQVIRIVALHRSRLHLECHSRQHLHQDSTFIGFAVSADCGRWWAPL